MADRWLYIHAGAAHGPVDLDKLVQLAGLGKLLPTDAVWPVGEERRHAVEAQTLLKIEAFPGVQAQAVVKPAIPIKPASEVPDWLSDVEAPAPTAAPPYSPDVELVEETADVEVVYEELAIEEIAAEPPARPSQAPKASAPTRNPVRREEADEEDEEEAGFDFRRRDLLMFGIGVIGLGLAVAAGLFFAKISQRTTDEDPPND